MHSAEVLEEAAGETGAIIARVRVAPENRGKLAGELKRAGLV